MSGNIGFIIVCTALVFIMTPGLAFFYGGLAKEKNVLNTMMMVIAVLGIGSLLWLVVGYSLSFSGSGSFVGNLDLMFFNNVSLISNDDSIPQGLFAIFQMMFALITVGILTGSVVGRMNFKALFIFIAVWSIIVYYPLAHMVWGGGFLDQIGSIDFAGGNVVHISSGISGLVLALVVGSRHKASKETHEPHNVPFVLLGTALLWFGWFGFNAGSALAADGLAVHALITTHAAAACALFSWMMIEIITKGKPSVVGACTGAVVGLVAITPGAGFVSIWSSILIGLLVSPVCYFSINVLKEKLGYDDTLDAFGCHGIGGIFGGICTGIFASPVVNGETGLIYGETKLFFAQIFAIIFTVIFASLLSFIIISIIKLFMPIRVSVDQEFLGLDLSEHNEKAYNLDQDSLELSLYEVEDKKDYKLDQELV